MVDLGAYEFKYLNTGEITPEELFKHSYIKELYESEHFLTATKQLHVILDSKYENIDFQRIMETQRKHLTATQCNELLKFLQKF